MSTLMRTNGDSPLSLSNVAPRVTVLMCVYNDERHVGAAVESILAQTFRNFELLIVNDGSTDRTPAMLGRYAAADSRIRVISIPNSGTTVAANRGLALAAGEYIARLDSDDVSLPERLAVEVEFLDRHPNIALVGGGSYLIDEDGRVVGRRNVCPRNAALALRSRCIFQQSDVMFRKAVVLQLGGYREKFRNAQDYDLWLRISDVAGVAKLPQMLGLWRVNPGGYTLARAAEQRYEGALVRRLARERRRTGADSYAATRPYPAQAHRQSITEGAHLRWLGTAALQDGRHEKARRFLAQSFARRRTAKTALTWLATFSPRWLMRAIVRCRDVYLNYRYIL